jgi:hypothetical protein
MRDSISEVTDLAQHGADCRVSPRSHPGPATIFHQIYSLNIFKPQIAAPKIHCSQVVGYALLVTSLALSHIAVALQSPAPAETASLLATPPRTWAVEAADNELKALHHPGSYLRYRMHVHDDKGDQIRDVIESKDGTVARLLQKNGHALTADEDQAERERLEATIASPSDYLKHVKNEETGRKLADSMIRLLPDAMIFTYTPDQPQSGTNHGAPELVMDYEPNPKWKPPTTTSAALTGLRGRLWLDAKTRHLVRMEGEIFQGVNFGWGMLAHIYPGGKLALEQTNAGGDRWIYTHFVQKVSVRALMVKTLNVHTNVDADSFQILPEIAYQDAIRTLLKTPLPAN